MLLRSLIIALAATLALSAPTAEPDTSIVVDRTTGAVALPVGLSARDANAAVEARDNDYAGFSVRCYDGPDCQGKPFYQSSDVIGRPALELSPEIRGLIFKFQHPANPIGSCRVDVWNGFAGNCYMLADDWVQISGKNYMHGWGQYCVNEWQDSFRGQGSKEVNKYVAVWRNATNA